MLFSMFTLTDARDEANFSGMLKCSLLSYKSEDFNIGIKVSPEGGAYLACIQQRVEIVKT